MKKQIKLIFFILLFLGLIDFGIAIFLSSSIAPDSLVRFFDYGRSVPGKLKIWQLKPNYPGNLFNVAWRNDIIAESSAKFIEEPKVNTPVIRIYGMSFVNNILRAAKEINPKLILDNHGGPGVPPNFTYALFLEDRVNRKSGDIAVLGILSSAVPAMASMTNRTWVFEQPAPLTYPIFSPSSEIFGLNRIDPLIQSAAEEIALNNHPQRSAEWHEQLETEDKLYNPLAFKLEILDCSPFSRLLRRAIVTRMIESKKQELLTYNSNDCFPYVETLRRLILNFAYKTRADEQTPVVVLIQTRGPSPPDLLAITETLLKDNKIPYFSTTSVHDPRDPSGFKKDGHYTHEVDLRFAYKFLELPMF